MVGSGKLARTARRTGGFVREYACEFDAAGELELELVTDEAAATEVCFSTFGAGPVEVRVVVVWVVEVAKDVVLW